MPLRRSTVDALDVCSTTSDGVARLDLRVGSGHLRAGDRAMRSAATAAPCAGPRSGPFRVEDADESASCRRSRRFRSCRSWRWTPKRRWRSRQGGAGTTTGAGRPRGRARCGERDGDAVVKVVRSPEELEPTPRAVAIGTFDGVHLGHRRVLDAVDGGRTWLDGRHVRPASTRRARLRGRAACDARAAARAARRGGDRGGARGRVRPRAGAAPAGGVRRGGAAADRRGGRRRRRELPLRPRLGSAISACSSGSASTCARCRSSRESRRAGSASCCAPARSSAPRACSGGRRSWRASSSPATRAAGRSAFPTANLRLDPSLLVPKYGIYAGAAEGHRAAISIGTNPHYGGGERRIEAYLLDFEGDLYGKRLVLQLWRRLRDERAFESEAGARRADRPRRRGDAGAPSRQFDP